MNLIHTTNVTADLAYEVQSQPRVEIPLQDKIRISLDAIKQQIIEGKHPCCSYSGGKDSSVTLNLAITAIRELKNEGVIVPTLHIIHSDTALKIQLSQPITANKSNVFAATESALEFH